jgi:Domain of unknown function (DUF3644)
MVKKRARRLKSIATELVKKAREAMLTSVQVFNNPQIEFKSELFIVTNIIAWTYLLHAHYRKKKIEYRSHRGTDRRRGCACHRTHWLGWTRCCGSCERDHTQEHD